MPTGLVKTHVEYEMKDWRFTNPAMGQIFFKRTRGKDSYLYLFRGGWAFLGLGGRLWRLHKWPRAWFQDEFFIPDQDWFSKLKKPHLELSVASSNPGRWARTNEYKFKCIVCETDERFKWSVLYARLENVMHNLVRIQRWTKRMLRRARVRLVLLMALHPRLGAKAGIAVLGPDLLLALTLL